MTQSNHLDPLMLDGKSLTLEQVIATLTNVIILVASAVFALILQKGLSKAFVPLAGLLVFLGLYGALTTYKLYERYRFSKTELLHWSCRLDELHPEARLLKLESVADKEHKVKFPRLERLTFYQLWMVIHLLISLSGIVLLIVIVCR